MESKEKSIVESFLHDFKGEIRDLKLNLEKGSNVERSVFFQIEMMNEMLLAVEDYYFFYHRDIKKSSLDFIRLASPTTDLNRMDEILKKSSGFIYYVSITGVTGSKLIKLVDIKKKYLSLKAKTKLPFVIGFGINSPKKAKDIASYSDGVVIGSNLIKEIENNINSDSKIKDNVINLVKKYSKALNKKK